MHQVVPFTHTLEPYAGALWSCGEGCRLQDTYVCVCVCVCVHIYGIQAPMYLPGCKVTGGGGVWDGSREPPPYFGVEKPKTNILEVN